MKNALLIVCALGAFSIVFPANARDDGGFGPTVIPVPAALGDNTQDLIARGEISGPDVANIEPAAGDEKSPAVEGSQKKKVAVPSLIKSDPKKIPAK